MVRYFDDNEENIFCGNDCLEESLSVNHFIFEKNNGDDSVYVNEDDEDEQV